MTALLRPRSAAELGDLLRSGLGRVRLVGTGTRQERLPAATNATTVSLAGLDRIHRLDAPDQTCSVDVGVRREVLDEALLRHRLELPCLGDGSLGGLFASDPIGPATAGGASPRTLLLGMEAMLACGTAFRAGARVVKSVAGFDVHKLLVGSRGTLFAATQLHLRLKPMPRASVWFAVEGLELAAAVAHFVALRSLAVPPAQLHLQRGAAGCSLSGRLVGRASFVTATMRALGLREGAPLAALHLAPPAGGEVLSGCVTPSRVAELLAAVPANAPFLLHGGGRFELAAFAPAVADDLLDRLLPQLGVHACIAAGAPARRGLGTRLNPGQQRLTDGLKQALDPHGTFV